MSNWFDYIDCDYNDENKVEAFFYNETGNGLSDLCSKVNSGFIPLISNTIKKHAYEVRLFIDFNCELHYRIQANQVLDLSFKLCRATKKETVCIKTWDFVIDTMCGKTCNARNNRLFDFATQPPVQKPIFCLEKDEIIRFVARDNIICGNSYEYIVKVRVNNCSADIAQLLYCNLFILVQGA